MYRFLFLIIPTLLTSSIVMDRVQEYLDRNTYIQYRPLIQKMFFNEERFIFNNRVDVVSIIQRLKENGILKLYLQRPRTINIEFIANGEPKLFLKTILDILQELGYFKYRIVDTQYSDSNMSINVKFVSDYILDPTLFYESLQKRNGEIIDIKRLTNTHWRYEMDISNIGLNVQYLPIKKKVKLRTPISDYWFRVGEGKKIEFISIGNNWHPYIVFYNKKLEILKIYQRDRKTVKLRIKIPKETRYIKITDIYLLNNIKNGLQIYME